MGYTLVFQDITEEVRREQRLSVLNHVLRHNLRNDMTVVKGNVAVAQDTDNEETVAHALETAGEKADELITTSQKAREVAATLQSVAGDSTQVDVYSQCTAIAETYREAYPEATITVEGETTHQVETSPAVLTTVIENLVDNALRHGGEHVTISVEERPDGVVCLTVADDGPGIPETELQTIRSGTETDLQHGSEFGLWVVKWGAELLGRDVTFETSEDGTTATVCIPDQREEI